MKSHAAAASASPLPAAMYSAPRRPGAGVSPGPGIGPTPMSSRVIPGIRPPLSADDTVPSAADVVIAIAAG